MNTNIIFREFNRKGDREQDGSRGNVRSRVNVFQVGDLPARMYTNGNNSVEKRNDDGREKGNAREGMVSSAHEWNILTIDLSRIVHLCFSDGS